MRRIKTLAVLGGILLVVFVAVLGWNGDRENWPVEFQTNGERIYFTGISSSGFRIGANGGGMHMQMHDSGCATCHGADRQGRRLMPKFWKAAPSLTPSALFGEHSETSEENGHGGHEGYNDDTLRQAITEGIDPDGNPLDQAMPRWSMDARDMADLTEFLKSPVRNDTSPGP
ncbi:MAG: c-type cytochrome [Alphaproteobacteria bacterium]|nr:c-type cytochrome [Alphaproteobacteria bacterium]